VNWGRGAGGSLRTIAGANVDECLATGVLSGVGVGMEVKEGAKWGSFDVEILSRERTTWRVLERGTTVGKSLNFLALRASYNV